MASNRAPAVRPPTTYLLQRSMKLRRSMFPWTYRPRSSSSSGGKSDAFMRSMATLLGAGRRADEVSFARNDGFVPGPPNRRARGPLDRIAGRGRPGAGPLAVRCRRTSPGVVTNTPGDGGLRRPFPKMAIRPGNEVTAERVALGRLLYFDPVLSGGNDLSCAPCHHPDLGLTDGRGLSMGKGGKGLGPEREGGTQVRRGAPTERQVQDARGRARVLHPGWRQGRRPGAREPRRQDPGLLAEHRGAAGSDRLPGLAYRRDAAAPGSGERALGPARGRAPRRH